MKRYSGGLAPCNGHAGYTTGGAPGSALDGRIRRYSGGLAPHAGGQPNLRSATASAPPGAAGRCGVQQLTPLFGLGLNLAQAGQGLSELLGSAGPGAPPAGSAVADILPLLLLKRRRIRKADAGAVNGPDGQPATDADGQQASGANAPPNDPDQDPSGEIGAPLLGQTIGDAVAPDAVPDSWPMARPVQAPDAPVTQIAPDDLVAGPIQAPDLISDLPTVIPNDPGDGVAARVPAPTAFKPAPVPPSAGNPNAVPNAAGVTGTRAARGAGPNTVSASANSYPNQPRPITSDDLQRAKTAVAVSEDVYRAQPGQLSAGNVRALNAREVADRFGSDVASRLVDNTHGADFQARIYVANEGRPDQTYYVAFRGTQGPTNLQDVGTDLGESQNYVPFVPPAYKDAINLGYALSKSRVNGGIVLVGHSLGGGEASAASIATGYHAITLNSAGLNDATIKMAAAANANNRNVGPGEVLAYHVGPSNDPFHGDPVTYAQTHPGAVRALGSLLFGPLGGAIHGIPAYGRSIELSGPAGYAPSDHDYHSNFSYMQNLLDYSVAKRRAPN